MKNLFSKFITGTLPKKILALYAVLFIGAIISLGMVLFLGQRFIDFQWVPARMLLLGQNPYINSFTDVLFDGQRIESNQVPSALMLLFPFALLPRMIANELWLFSNLIFTGIFLFYCRKLWFNNKETASLKTQNHMWIAASLILLISTPWQVLMWNGQHLMFSLAFFTAAIYYCFKKDSNILSGILLALSLFKYTTICPLLLIFLTYKKIKPIIIAAAIHLILTVIAGIYLNESPIDLIIQSIKVGSNLVGFGECDFGSISRIFNIGDMHALAILGYIIFFTLAIIITFFGRQEFLFKLSLLAVISNTICYHRIYDFVSLFFPLCLIFLWLCSKNISLIQKIIIGIIITNCCWFFWGHRIVLLLSQAGLYSWDTYRIIAVGCSSSLNIILLTVLLIYNFNKTTKTNIAEFPKTKSETE